VIYDFGVEGADVARILDTGPGYDTIADFDMNTDGVIDAADATPTDAAALDATGLILRFDAAGAQAITFHGNFALDADTLLFV